MEKTVKHIWFIKDLKIETIVEKICIIFLVVTSGIFLLFTFAVAEDIPQIVINPFMKKIPVAVTDFKLFSGHLQELKAGKKAKMILRDALNFTGYLKTMNPFSFLSNPAETGIQLNQIQFRDWTGIGAELLITGGVFESQGKVKLELRLIDILNTKLLVGVKYTASESQIRSVIHKFCSEISKVLTGNYGIFNSRIAFVSTVKGNKEIFICDFDGQNIRQLTFHKSITLSPSWSSDQKWLAYVSYARGNPRIFIRHLKERRGSIINYKGLNSSPDWMPGQRKLIASLSFSGDQEIYLLTIKGERIKRITKSWGIDVSPNFSPDGKKIVFTSKRTGTPQIYIKELASGRIQRLTFKGMNNTSPVWSPDGEKIAYVGIEENRIDIYVININSGLPVKLTMDAGDNEDPSWSPDGSMIVFTSTREGGIPRIYVMNASGTDQRRLLKLSGEQSQPDWSMSIDYQH